MQHTERAERTERTEQRKYIADNQTFYLGTGSLSSEKVSEYLSRYLEEVRGRFFPELQTVHHRYSTTKAFRDMGSLKKNDPLGYGYVFIYDKRVYDYLQDQPSRGLLASRI